MGLIPTRALRASALAMALISPCYSQAAEIIVGPGVVAPLQILGQPGTTHRFLAGTKITGSNVRPDIGVPVHILYQADVVFDGGLYEAAPRAVRGSGVAVLVDPSSLPSIVIHDGVFRAGNALVTALPPSGARGPTALLIGTRSDARISIYGGKIEGGILALESAPDVLINRGFAIEGGYDIRNRHIIDVYGGTLLGGVRINATSKFTVHGSDLKITPDLAGPFYAPTEFTITGKYADGSTFTHSVLADVWPVGEIRRTADSLTVGVVNAPEPSSTALMLCVAAVLPRSRRRAPSLSPSPGHAIRIA